MIEIIDDAKFWRHATTASRQNTRFHPDEAAGEGDGVSRARPA